MDTSTKRERGGYTWVGDQYGKELERACILDMKLTEVSRGEVFYEGLRIPAVISYDGIETGHPASDTEKYGATCTWPIGHRMQIYTLLLFYLNILQKGS